MSVTTHSAPSGRVSPARIKAFACLVAFGLFPVLVIGTLFVAAAQDDTIAEDFQQFYGAAVAMLHGHTPYPDDAPQAVWGGPYPYPPFPALVTAPLTALPFEPAGAVVMVLLVVAAFATLFVVGVRDWRCYGMALLWPSVISAIQTGNLTLFLGLCAAIAWRCRDRVLTSSVALGVSLAAKIFLWPLVIWFAATRRAVAGALAFLVGAGLLLVSWSVISFDGLLGYPERLRKLDRVLGEDSYTAYIVGQDAGLPSTAARAVWLVLGLALLVSVVGVGMRGDERASFVLAIAAALALTPIVWLHYFALLLLVVAIAQPSLGVLWFVPLGMVVTPGSGHPAPWQTAWTLVVAAVTIGWALWLVRREGRDLVPLRTAPQPT